MTHPHLGSTECPQARAAYPATRVVIGFLFACHGSATLLGWPHLAAHGGPVPVGVWPGWWAALIQLTCGLLVATGWRTRPAALLASGSMAYAYFVVHQAHGLLPAQNGGETAALYAWVFLLLAALGSGAGSVDALIERRRPVTYYYPGHPTASAEALVAAMPPRQRSAETAPAPRAATAVKASPPAAASEATRPGAPGAGKTAQGVAVLAAAGDGGARC